MKKLLNLAVLNTIHRDSYEETEHWFLQIPESLAPVAMAIATYILGISLYEVESSDGFENQNLVKVIQGDSADDQRDQLIHVSRLYKISDQKFTAAQELQSVMHYPIYSWQFVKETLSTTLYDFVETFRDDVDQLQKLVDESKDSAFYQILLKHIVDLDPNDLGEQVMGAIIADLDKLSDTLGEAQLLELVED